MELERQWERERKIWRTCQVRTKEKEKKA